MVISSLNECLGQRAGGGRTNDVWQLTQAMAPVLVHPFLANKQHQATVALLKTLFVYARVVRVRACLRSRVGRTCMNALLILIGSKT